MGLDTSKLQGQKTQVKHGALNTCRELLGKAWFGRRLEAVVRGRVCRVPEPRATSGGAQAGELFGDEQDCLKNT